MKALLLLVYSLGLNCYLLLAHIAGFFNAKAKTFIHGRNGLWEELEKALAGKTEKRIWFHFASLGEFEQGRPVMEQLKLEYPGYKLLITFFSPSGYQIQKNYKGADYVFYLPFDSPRNAKKFLDLVNPALVIFVKYEFWLYYLRQLSSRSIPTFLISAVFRPDQVFFKPVIGHFFTSHLHAFKTIFLQNAASLAQAEKLKLPQCLVAGDTRFDRVTRISNERKEPEGIKQFIAGRKVLIAGSSWPAEENMIAGIYTKPGAEAFCFMLVPHDISSAHIKEIRQKFPDGKVYSEWDKKSGDFRVLIIDRIGLLSSLYQYGDVALVGGGFGSGLHNILEAAVYGIPVLHGPNISKFWEAEALLKSGGSLLIESEDQFNSLFTTKVLSEQWRKEAGGKAKEFIAKNTGATRLIMAEIRKTLA